MEERECDNEQLWKATRGRDGTIPAGGVGEIGRRWLLGKEDNGDELGNWGVIEIVRNTAKWGEYGDICGPRDNQKLWTSEQEGVGMVCASGE